MNDELLRPADVEAIYGPGLSQEVLRSLRRSGTGPAWFPIGRRINYARSDIDAWLAAQRQQQRAS